MPLIEQAVRIVEEVKRSDWRGKRSVFCLRLTPAVEAYVKQTAKSRRMTMTAVINEAIAEHALVRTK